MKKTNLFAILAIAATPAFLHAQTNFSDVVGYTTLNIRGKTGANNALTFIACNVHRPNVYRGIVTQKTTNGSGQTVLSFSSPGFTSNQFSASTNKHYVRITSTNANTGLIAEIVSNDASSITVADNLNAVIDINVSAIEVRPYWTLSQAFPGGAGLKTGTSASAADTITIVNPNTGAGDTYFYHSTSGQWRKGATDSSSVVIHPGSGILVTRKDASAVSIRMAGEVIGSTIQADVASAPATGQRLTYIANPFPVASRTLAQSGLYTGNSSTGVAGGTSSSAADTVTIYDPNSGAALVYYYNTTQGKWLRGATDSSNVTIPEGAAVVITRKNGRPAFDWYIPSPVNLNL